MKIALAAILAALLLVPARAEEKTNVSPAKSSWSDFLKNMRNALSQSAVGGERKKGRAGAVAAIRGKNQKNMADPNEPTLRGDKKSSKVKIEAQYDAELVGLVELLEKGELEKGIKGLEAFKVAHPKHDAEEVEKLIVGAKAALAEKGGGASAAPVAAADEAAKP